MHFVHFTFWRLKGFCGDVWSVFYNYLGVWLHSQLGIGLVKCWFFEIHSHLFTYRLLTEPGIKLLMEIIDSSSVRNRIHLFRQFVCFVMHQN